MSTSAPPWVSGVTAATISGRRVRSVSMEANATVIGVLTVRPIGEDELDWFVGLDPDAPGLDDSLRELWASGDGATGWTLVAERDARPVGRAALYTEPLGCEL